MHRYTENAKRLLLENDITLVFTDGNEVVTSHTRGVLSLVVMVMEKESMKGFYCADKVVGKAAAFMYAILKPEELYAFVLSEKAERILEKYGVKYFFGEKVPAIINRKGDGFCPMETATENAETPEEALEILREKLNLKGEHKKGEWAEEPVLKNC